MTLTPRKRTATSARRTPGVTLIGVLVLACFGAYTVLAAGGKEDFTIAASPSSQTVTPGQAGTYTVTVTRVNGFTGSVTLTAGSLPAGATASWKLSNGTTSNVVPPNLNSATLTVQTATSTPQGTSQPLITATSGKLTSTTNVTLAVQPAAQPNFTLSASPASRTIVQGDQAAYSVDITRTGGFSGSVALSVTGLPKNATATWNGSTVQIDTAGNSQADTYGLTITGTGTINGSTVARSASVTLIVQKNQTFGIAGDLAARLAPGRKAPLDPLLTNPQNFDILITNLAVAVEEGTTKPGCSGSQNFKVTQMPVGRYPITLPAGQSRTLGQLGVADGDKPQVEMLDQPWNQDACKNVSIRLAYSGSATK